jgi:hypothetical protein
MDILVNLKLKDILKSLQILSPDELEQVKNTMVKRDVYFKRFKKSPIQDITSDFSKAGYSKEFIDDLEAGLKKSSAYLNEHQTAL